MRDSRKIHHRGLLLAGIALVCTVAGIAWYARPIMRARIVGVDWRSTVRQSSCITTWRQLWCTTVRPGVAPTDYTMLAINPLTRGVLRIDRTRSLSDSMRWSAIIDSSHRAMEMRRGEPVPCDTSETRFRTAEAWRFGNEETRLYSAPLPPTKTHGPYWYVSMQLVPLGSAGCGREFRYVLLTPTQIAQRVREWITDWVGF